jgi:hypothetical protein
LKVRQACAERNYGNIFRSVLKCAKPKSEKLPIATYRSAVIIIGAKPPIANSTKVFNGFF